MALLLIAAGCDGRSYEGSNTAASGDRVKTDLDPDGTSMWHFNAGATQDDMLDFLRQFGKYSQNGHYWLSADPEMFLAMKLRSSSAQVDQYANFCGNVLSIRWYPKAAFTLEQLESGLVTKATDEYKAKWPHAKISACRAANLSYNGCPTIRTMIDVDAPDDGATLRSYVMAIGGTQHDYVAALVHQHEVPGLPGSHDARYWNDKFQIGVNLLLLGFIPVDATGKLPTPTTE
jgi:hypothetical protein